MSMSIGVITGLIALGGLGVGYYLINSKNTKRKKLENEVIVPYTRPVQERIKFAKVNTNVKNTTITTSNVKKSQIPLRSSNTTRSHNTYDDDDLSLLNTVMMINATDSISDNHNHRSHNYSDSHDHGSSSHSSSYDSHSSYDSSSSSSSYDSGSCDCSCGCD